MKYVYILLICLILYYIITRYFEKYYSQENFDPSLVPVSSIITLAKVAQKIVDGNGTLTNPANLNIGTTNAKGNLLVTGNTRTNGNEIVDGTLGVTGATTIGSTLGVTGATTLNTLGVTGATTVGGTLGVTGATTIGASGATAATNNLTVNGAENIKGNSKIEGTLNVTGDTTLSGVTTFANNVWHKSADGNVRQHYINGGDTYIGSPEAWRFQTKAPSPKDVVTIDKNGNMAVTGSLTIGDITLSNVNGELKISSGISAGSITSSGNVTATGGRNGGGLVIRGPSFATNNSDYSSIIRDNFGRLYNIDGLYSGQTPMDKTGGGGPCSFTSADNCIGPGKKAGIIY